MLERRSSPQSIAWFVDLFHGKQLNLDPPYQRRSVWNQDYKQYFIDTILRNYPSPPVFLDVKITPGGRTVYHVVDGKQRLSAILEYLTDMFCTSERHADPTVANKYFSDLNDDFQNRFLRYIIPVEFLENADDTELEEAFDRLNRNVAKLNAQELRNAKYSGVFISLMETLADDPFWHDIGLATTSRIRRMLDIEYVSEIFLLTMHGIQEGKTYLDQAYADYDEEIPDIETHRRIYENCKTFMVQLWPHLGTDRFINLADFYSLWAAVMTSRIDHINVIETARRLSEFANSVRSGSAFGEAQEYLVAATQGSNKRANRELRARILKSLFVEQE
ncbi:hypothetical protein BAC1_01518 [uncultured bacterium]|nr:hypothetical protein BAC1_01518 [uncultured bacterium]